MAGASADGEQNPWPAFVDVLTAVIMVVTFLLVIMCAAVMSLSSKIVAEVKESLGADKMVAKQAEIDVLKAEIERLRRTSGNTGGAAAEAMRATQLTRIEPVEGDLRRAIVSKQVDPDAVQQIESPQDTADQGGQVVQSADVLLTLKFDNGAVKLQPEVEQESIAVVKSANLGPDAKFDVYSTAVVNGSVSDARRNGFYRAMVARNTLIRAGVKANNINAQVRVVENDAQGDNVRIVAKP
jgi:hypothetical protein